MPKDKIKVDGDMNKIICDYLGNTAQTLEQVATEARDLANKTKEISKQILIEEKLILKDTIDNIEKNRKLCSESYHIINNTSNYIITSNDDNNIFIEGIKYSLYRTQVKDMVNTLLTLNQESIQVYNNLNECSCNADKAEQDRIQAENDAIIAEGYAYAALMAYEEALKNIWKELLKVHQTVYQYII